MTCLHCVEVLLWSTKSPIFPKLNVFKISLNANFNPAPNSQKSTSRHNSCQVIHQRRGYNSCTSPFCTNSSFVSKSMGVPLPAAAESSVCLYGELGYHCNRCKQSHDLSTCAFHFHRCVLLLNLRVFRCHCAHVRILFQNIGGFQIFKNAKLFSTSCLTPFFFMLLSDPNRHS